MVIAPLLVSATPAGCRSYDPSTYCGTAPLRSQWYGFPEFRSTYAVALGDFDLSKTAEVVHECRNLPRVPMWISVQGVSRTSMSRAMIVVQQLDVRGAALVESRLIWPDDWTPRCGTEFAEARVDYSRLAMEKHRDTSHLRLRVAVSPIGALSTGETIRVALVGGDGY